MRWNVLRLPAVIAFIVLLSGSLAAQNCIPTAINGTTINLACNQVCQSLPFQVPHMKSTVNYSVVSIPYAPYPYVTAAGSEYFPLYADDQYSNLINLPFEFCFYNDVYNNVVVGSNGLITFDPVNASCANAWPITQPIPFSGGSPCLSATTYYPRASIMANYTDLDPRTSASPLDRKIQWEVIGTAPCRKFVVSYYRIGVYGNNACGLANPCTFQIVLHESTGIIDIFFENKSCQTTSSGGRAILGLQNWNQDQAVSVPGHNNAVWTESNSGYRFIPSSGPSRFLQSQLLTLSGTVVATADTSTTIPGILDLSFPNVCPPAGSTQYVVRTSFSACGTTGAQLISLDTITVNRTNNLNATATATNTACGPPTGTIVVAVPAGAGTPPFTYQLDGGTPVISTSPYTFTAVASGPHTVVVTDNSGGCTSTINLSVGQNTTLTASPLPVPASCPGVNNGAVIVTASGGSAPFTFTVNPGNIVQTGATGNFSGLAPGSYTVSVSDGGGCSTTTPAPFTITAGPALTTTANAANALCNGSATGTITVIQPSSGTAPYQYSLDGTNWQSSNVFNGLTAGVYTVRFRESNGCQGQLTVTVGQPNALAAAFTTVPVICNGQNNGIITMTASGGIPPYQYSLDGINWQSSNVFNVAAGTYTVTTRDNNLCSTTQTITVTEPPALTATAATTNASCNGGPDGSITVTASGGNSNYQYSINGTNFQVSNTFNVVAGTYTAVVRDNLGCTFSVPNIIVGLDNDLTYTTPANPTICEGSSTQLQITSNALQYAWAPATGLSNTAVANPVANPTVTANYTVTLTLGGCSIDVPVTVNVNPAPIPDAGPDGFICYGQSYQLQAAGGTQFNWTPAVFLNSSTISNPVSTPANTVTYSLSVVDANGCPSLVTDDVTIDVTPPITVYTFPFDTIVYEGDQFPVLATSIATDYVWTPAIGLDNPTIPNPTVTAGAAGDVITYKVTASTFAGCKGEGYVRVQVYKGPDIYMPTGFTPNGDGKNDIFRPFTVGIKQISYFKVFNRWGQLLYSTKTLGAGWDGKLGGVQQASGLYVWMVEGLTNDNRVITKRGTVALLR